MKGIRMKGKADAAFIKDDFSEQIREVDLTDKIQLSRNLGDVVVEGAKESEREHSQITRHKKIVEQRIFEDISLRTEFSKHYKQKDGSYIAKIYNEPVHFLNAEKLKFEEIDNSLVFRTENSNEEDDFAGFENVSGEYQIRLSNGNGADLCRIKKGIYSVKWQHKDVAQIGNLRPKRVLGDNSAATSFKGDNEAIYENFAENADLQYVIKSGQVKENIIVKAAAKKYEYCFLLKTKNLTAELSSTGTELNFLATDKLEKEVIFSIPVPYMFDQKEQFSDEVYYDISEISDNMYDFKIIAKKEWIESADREFPITIDPTIIVQDVQTIKTKTLCSEYDSGLPEDSLGTIRNLSYSVNAAKYLNEKRMYIKFNLQNSFFELNKINSAKLNLYVYNMQQDIVSDPPRNEKYKVYQVTAPEMPWDSGTAKFTGIQHSFMYQYIDYDLPPRSMFSLDVSTALASSSAAQRGIAIMAPPISNAQHLSVYSEYHNVYKPSLEISYVPIKQLKGSESYSESVLQAGTFGVDMRCGSLKFAHSLKQLGGEKLPFELSCIFRSDTRKEEGTLATGSFRLGKGWKLNVQQYLFPIVGSEEGVFEGIPTYKFLDQFGDEHIFSKFAKPNEPNLFEYKDEQGTGLTCNADGTVITDKDGTTMLFCYNTLAKITDKYSNNITFSHNESSKKIEKIVDGAGRNILFNYDEHGRLSRIVYADNTSTYLYYASSSNNQLIRILDASGNETSFAYGESQFSNDTYNLTTVTDQTGYFKNFFYSENNFISKVSDGTISKKISSAGINYFNNNEDGKTLEVGKSLYFTYSNNGARLTTDGGHNANYIFDNYGLCITKYSTESSRVSAFQHKSADGAFTYQLQSFPNAENIIESVNKNDWVSDYTWCYDNSVCFEENNLFNKRLRMNGNNTGSGFLYESLNKDNLIAKGIANGDTLLLSGFANASCEMMNANDELKFQLRAVVEYSGGTETYKAMFNPTIEQAWQMAAVGFKINNISTLNKVDIYIDYTNNAAHGFFDKLVLAKGVSISQEKVSAGTSGDNQEYTRIDNGVNKVRMYSNEKGLIKKQVFINAENSEFTTNFQYDSANDLVSTSNEYRNTEQLFSNSPSSQIIESSLRVKGVSGANRIVNRIIKDSGRNYISRMYDERYKDENESEIYGESAYNTAKDQLDYIVMPNGEKINYTYNNKGEIIGMAAHVDAACSCETSDNASCNAAECVHIDYGYCKGLITSMTGNGNTFMFEYDGFSRITKVTLNNVVITSNEYEKGSYSPLGGESAFDCVKTALTNGWTQKSIVDKLGRLCAKKLKSNQQGDYEVLRVAYKGNTENINTVKDNYLSMASGTAKEIVTTFNYNDNGEVKSTALSGYRTGNMSNTMDREGRTTGASISFSENSASVASHNYAYNYDSNTNGLSGMYPDNRLMSVTLPTSVKSEHTYDNLGRVSTKNLNIGASVKETYTYLQGGKNTTYTNVGGCPDGCGGSIGGTLVPNTSYDRTTSYISAVSYTGGHNSNEYYKYDKNGNIISKTVGNNTIRYSYDSIDRLKREDNQYLNKSFEYIYDRYGNIMSVRTYNFTTGWLGACIGTSTYSYANNQLTAISSSGSSAPSNVLIGGYDGMGNPCSYKGNTLSWIRGRMLRSFGAIASYLYDANGVRQEKTVGATTHRYYTVGNRIIAEKKNSDSYEYYYDASGIIGMKYNGANYYFQKNIQGDVERVFNLHGVLVGYYRYDAWGNHRVFARIYNNADIVDITENSQYNTDIMKVNPFRYRGYYYDQETRLYYLNSRYYDPETKRFINADDISYAMQQSDQLNGLNLYAYCGNNPVNLSDSTGQSWESFLGGVGNWFAGVGTAIGNFFSNPEVQKGLMAIGSSLLVIGGIACMIIPGAQFLTPLLLGAGVSSLVGGFTNEAMGGSFFGGWVGGLLTGAISGIPGVGPLGALALGFAGGFAGTMTTGLIDGKKLSNPSLWGASLLAGLGNGVFNMALSFFKPAFGIAKTSDWFNGGVMGYSLYYGGISAFRSWLIGLATGKW